MHNAPPFPQLIVVMNTLPPDLEKRLMELEIKAGLADDLLDQLNHTIFRQQRQIDLLGRELAELRKQSQESRQPQARSLTDDIPPHY